MTDKPNKPSPEEALAAIREAGRTGDFEIAGSEELDQYEVELEAFRLALRAASGIKRVGFSDQSALCDFGLPSAQVLAIGEAIGVSVASRDTILDICKRMRRARSS